MSEKLKPCPFCGGIAAMFKMGNRDEWGVDCCSVPYKKVLPNQCPMQKGSFGMYPSETEAIAAWNKRTSDGLVSVLAGALEQSLSGLKYFQSKSNHLTLPITMDVMDKEVLQVNIEQATQALSEYEQMREKDNPELIE